MRIVIASYFRDKTYNNSNSALENETIHTQNLCKVYADGKKHTKIFLNFENSVPGDTYTFTLVIKLLIIKTFQRSWIP